MPRTIKTITRTIEATTYTCDWCGEEILGGFCSPECCSICARFACAEHGKDWGSVYGMWYCHDCWEVGKPYRRRMAEYEKAGQAERKAWYAVARDAAKDTNDAERG